MVSLYFHLKNHLVLIQVVLVLIKKKNLLKKLFVLKLSYLTQAK